ITNLLRLLKLPDEALELVDKGMLTPGQARPLLGVGDRKMLARLSARIVREGWSARRVEDEVARLTSGTRSGSTGSGKTSGSRRDPNIANLEKKIRTRLTAKVQVAHKKNGAGSITIHYNNLDDLDRLLEAMKVK
ncbi:MAG: chromosome partitioning protein ParB, partial [Leptospiraceae bacterium]|nr:chromosome partitioning protein ParB [Leptospiraceae bacterium]